MQFSAVPDGAPKRVRVEASPDGGLVIKWNQFSWYFIPAFVAAAFMCFFCIGRTYGEQLLRLACGGKLELHMMIFGLPFLAITIFSVAEALWFLLGRTEVTRTGNSLTVYRGIFGIGLRKRLAIPAGAKFVISQSGTINKMPVFKLAMNGGQGITALMKSTRCDVIEYIADVLNT